MCKMIFSDFDDTMLDYYSVDNYFDEYKITILKKVQERGIKFCIVTGRSIPFFKQFPNLFEVVDYIIGSNGACIYDVKNNKFINQVVINESEFNVIVNYALDNKLGFLLNCKNRRFSYGTWDDNSCYGYNSNNIYFCEQIILSCVNNRLEEILAFLDGVNNININNISDLDGLSVIDVNDSSVSKGGAVEWLCDYLNIDINDVIAFGDGENDKSLFRVVNNGIAVGNAIDKLKILSKDVALECDNNGIYRYIEDNILK